MKYNKEFLKGNFGIEKETLRVNFNGEISNKIHPFKAKFNNPHITVDFAEQQVEVITGIHNSIDSAIKEIELLTNIVYRHLHEDEILWNYSMPYKGQEKAKIAIDTGKENTYRKRLLNQYSLKTQLISGIHFNFSFSKKITKKMSNQEINEFYFNIAKKYRKYSFVIKDLFGMSPTTDFKKFDQISYRQLPKAGYLNNAISDKDYDTYQTYRDGLNQAIKNRKIQHWRENYEVVRTKPFDSDRIEWLEIRNVDLDYTEDYSLSEEKLSFIHLFSLFIAFNELPTITPRSKINDFECSIKILKQMKSWMITNNLDLKSIEKYIKILEDGNYFAKQKPNPINIIEQQKLLKQKLDQVPLLPIQKMELSTQILIEQSYIDGRHVQIIDQDKNIIKIDGLEIEAATLTGLDSPQGMEIISDKIKTNIFLTKKGYDATSQNIYFAKNKCFEDFEKFENKQIVIKPSNANFSNGITIFEKKFNIKDFKEAVEFAFEYDVKIIIEDFVDGQEYRFLVINDRLVGILKRISANVVGDGISSIEELIKVKNLHHFRGQNYKLPLEKIKLGKIETDFLGKKGFTKSSIPKKDEQIFLRKNSNISTGGDSIDVTDEVHPKYKEIALKVTKELGLKVCGLDIIIKDIDEFKDYTILEMNWNPAIHIHTYPFKGKNRFPAKELVKLIVDNTVI